MFEQRRIALGFPDPRMKHLPDKSVWEDFDAVIRTGEAITRNISSRDMIIRITITAKAVIILMRDIITEKTVTHMRMVRNTNKTSSE
jgi:hypothetical protein